MEQLVQKYTRELANLRCKKREVCNRLEKLQRVRDYMKNSIQDNCDNVNSKIRLGADKISNGVIMRDKTLLLEYDIREEAEADMWSDSNLNRIYEQIQEEINRCSDKVTDLEKKISQTKTALETARTKQDEKMKAEA